MHGGAGLDVFIGSIVVFHPAGWANPVNDRRNNAGKQMFLSVFEVFKVGVGPSSSHTMGPMVAGARFLDRIRALPFAVSGLRASLHGSLAFTGVGHATDRATILGLCQVRQ